MSRVRAGIDIGSRFVHIVVWKNAAAKKSVTQQLPEGLVKEGRVIAPAAMGDFLRMVRRKNHLGAKDAALVLHDRECFCRRVELPPMSDRQLRVNLPYEFRDFISGDKDQYCYDYAVLPNKEPPEPSRMELMAAAAHRETIRMYRDILRRGGFDLKCAIPEEMAYINAFDAEKLPRGGVCLLDMGHTALRMYMFQDGQYQSGRSLDYGCGALDDILARELNVDPFLACTYRESNYDHCQELPVCMELYNSMALEVMKAVNYYNFSSQGRTLERVCCCGGGVSNGALLQVLRETLPIPVETAGEKQRHVSLAALGAAAQRG